MALWRRRRWLHGKSPIFSLERFALPLIKAGLLAVAFFMTWRGVSDFVSSLDLTLGPKTFDLGGLTFSTTSIGSAFVVLMLILAMYIALLKWISPIGWWKRLLAGVLYALIALFSIGFGYGFWWGLFASKEVSNADAVAASENLRDLTSVISIRLERIRERAEGVARESRDSARKETNAGGTCGDNSGPTRGKRADFRDKKAKELEDAAAAASTSITKIRTSLASIDTPLNEYLQKRTAETGKDDLARLDSTLRRSAVTINELLRQVRTELTDTMKGVRDEFMRKKGEKDFVCTDEALAKSLDGAIKETELPLEITVPPLPYKEGAEATATAVVRLWQSVGAVPVHGWQIATLQIPWNAPISIPLLGKEAGGGRNIAALVAAIGVDFALLIFVLIGVRPPFDRFVKVVPASPDSLDKFLFLLETFIEEGDEEAIKFWRRCMLRVRARAFFVAPNPDLAPEEKRPYLEAVEVLASVLSEVNGVVPASRLRFREAWARGIQRLVSWGWKDPTRRHFDLYVLNEGEFREIATRLEQHKRPDAPEPTPPSHQAGPVASPGNPSWSAPISRPNPAADIAWARHLDRLFSGVNRGIASLRGPRPSPAQPLLPVLPPAEHREPTKTLQQILSETPSPGIGDTRLFGEPDELSPDLSKDADAATADSFDAAAPKGDNASVSVTLDEPKAIAQAELEDQGNAAAQHGATVLGIDVADMLKHLHDMDTTIRAMENLNSPGVVDGLAILRRQWQNDLRKYEIEPFGGVGDTPDPNMYFIRGSTFSELPAGQVVEVLRSGYRRGERMLHAADVIVSKGMPSNEAHQPSDEAHLPPDEVPPPPDETQTP